ncbi:MAG: hypothetical protein M1368_10760, partial [Thaumarchaeota archaeon]|nr:hypothetical protein [Nitrososphaerota archaeon]
MNGIIPAEAAGIKVDGENKLTTFQNASKSSSARSRFLDIDGSGLPHRAFEIKIWIDVRGLGSELGKHFLDNRSLQCRGPVSD